MTSASHKRSWTAYIVVFVVALTILASGLGRFGIWQPAELRIADLARGEGPAREAQSRPPLQIAAVRVGFNRLGATEVGGRLPTALFAVAATMALALAVAAASDARTGAFVGITYATMPLVFMNARQMFGGGVAQSAFTLLFAAIIYVFWGRPPPGVADDSPGGSGTSQGGLVAALWHYGRWLLLALVPLAIAAAGAMLGVVPVLLGASLAALLRWRYESRSSRIAGALLALVGVVTGYLCFRAAVAPHEGYDALTGVAGGPNPPRPLPTYETYIEQIGHGLFPWTGIAAFGVVRLLFAPPTQGLDKAASPVTIAEAWRESGMRLAAFVTLCVAFGVQSFHLQQFGLSPFIAVAPLAVATGVALRDAEREQAPWRLVVAGATFFTVIVVRDYMLFPKSSYAALGLPEGGPAFPTGFTTPLKDLGRVQTPTAEVYFLAWALIFIGLGLSPLFQGAGHVKSFAWKRPFTWIREIEDQARAELEREPPLLPAWLNWARPLLPTAILANLSSWLLLFAATVMVVFGFSAAFSPTLTTQVRNAFVGIAAIPLIVVLATYFVLALWNFYAWAGDPDRVWVQWLGSRVAFVPLAAFLAAVISTHYFVPALSEHLSPRGVWSVIRTVRRSNEPVARYGGNQNDRATRYYADFEPVDLHSESEAVEWLRQREPRHYMVVGADVFPSLNRSFRRAQPEGQRHNVPVIDATNSNLYVAASDLGSRPSRNPLDPFVMSVDRDNTGRLWHPHGRHIDGHFVPEPARFDDAIEYLGFNLDSNNMSYVPLGGSFKLTLHFRVLREVYGDHQIFIHVDGPCPRINGDHPPVGGRYPVRYWLPGDYIHDEFRVSIPSYCRAGRYYVYMGFFQGDDRMRVSGGEHDRENRVVAAVVNVR